MQILHVRLRAKVGHFLTYFFSNFDCKFEIKASKTYKILVMYKS